MRPDQNRIDALLGRYLSFYEGLRLRKIRPKTKDQRQFQDVAWGREEPVTEHEHAYVHYLKERKLGPFSPEVKMPHMDETSAGHMPGLHPVDVSAGVKWDAAWRGRRHPKGREYW